MKLLERLLERLNGGVALAVEGAPKTGKSWLLGTAASLGKTKLLVLKPREVNSYHYVKSGVNKDALVFTDPDWIPDLGKYECQAYLQFLETLHNLQDDDETEIVIIDPLTDLDRFIDHYLMAPYRISAPRDYPDGDKTSGMAFFGHKKKKFEDILPIITGLTHARRPKLVLCAIHTQPVKEADLKNKKHQDAIARGILFHGDILVNWEGGAKYGFDAEWDLVLHSDIERRIPEKTGQPPTTEYVIQVNATKSRHAGIALAPMFDKVTMPNDFPTLLEKIEEALE